jgi:hypothetical protein
MKTFTLHVPADAQPGDPDALEKAELVPDAFAWLAFVFTFLWFFFHRLWLAGLLVLVGLAILHGALNLLDVHPAASVVAQSLAGMLIGLEANSLRRWTYARRGRPARDVVLAARREEAEAKTFARWLDGGALRPAGPPARPLTAAASAPYRGEPVLGLFPEPERTR